MQANRYITTSNEEITTLAEGVKNHSKAYFRMRCEGLLLSSRGYKIAEIAQLYEVRTPTVRAWMDSWEQTGIAGLQIASGRGRKATIQLSDTVLVAQIKQELALNPQRLAQVGEQLSKSTGICLSKGQLQRFIKKSYLILGAGSGSVSKSVKTRKAIKNG